MNHGNLNPCLTGLGQFFIVFAQPPTPPKPGQGALHYPPPRQHLKLVAVQRTLDDLKQPATEGACPLHKLSSISPVGPNQLEPRESPHQFRKHQLGSITVLDVGSVDHYRKQQSQGIHHNMALTARHLLARVVAARPPFSVVFTDWLSMIAALGVGSRPSISRTLGCKVSWMCSQVPSKRHLRKYHHTVPQGGKSWGNRRQGMPPRKTYKMPFMTSRRSTVRGCPLELAGGSRGASTSHWASVRSLRYGFLLMLAKYQSLRPPAYVRVAQFHPISHTPS
jgi:hypothetical protein